jgi:hypothetical protein
LHLRIRSLSFNIRVWLKEAWGLITWDEAKETHTWGAREKSEELNIKRLFLTDSANI